MGSQNFDFDGLDALSETERATFPITLEPEFDYRAVDRIAGFWHGLGLKVEIKSESSAGYILILDLPD